MATGGMHSTVGWGRIGWDKKGCGRGRVRCLDFFGSDEHTRTHLASRAPPCPPVPCHALPCPAYLACYCVACGCVHIKITVDCCSCSRCCNKNSFYYAVRPPNPETTTDCQTRLETASSQHYLNVTTEVLAELVGTERVLLASTSTGR